MTAQQPKEIDLQQLNKWLRLPYVYQLIGSAEHPDWVQHELGLIKDGRFQITNLEPCLPPNKPEYSKMLLNGDERLNFTTATTKQQTLHQALSDILLTKFIYYNLKVVVKLNARLIPREEWIDVDSSKISIIESSIQLGDSNADILIEPESAYTLAKKIENERIHRETNSKRSGRPPNPHNAQIETVLKQTIQENPTIKNHSAWAKLACIRLRTLGIECDADSLRKKIKLLLSCG